MKAYPETTGHRERDRERERERAMVCRCLDVFSELDSESALVQRSDIGCLQPAWIKVLHQLVPVLGDL